MDEKLLGLKAYAYDLISQIELTQMELKNVNQKIGLKIAELEEEKQKASASSRPV